jgi:serine/threonine-protein kinase
MRTLRNAASLTTRSTRPLASHPVKRLLDDGQAVTSSESRLRYRITRLLGRGGHGQVYLARRIGRSTSVPPVVCIKATTRIDGWLREAYFGHLLDGHPRAIRVFDTFPILRDDGGVLYCLAIEFAAHGDLSTYLQRTGRGMSETVARREIAGILDVLRRLHRGQMMHRDLTPFNVFVCDRTRLKVGDFGIARQQLHHRGVPARTMNPFGAPTEFLRGNARHWQARDDVFQIGQLLAMLIVGDAGERIERRHVRHLPCSDHLKEVIYRCIGERRKRYESAYELIEALRTPPARFAKGVLKTLAGVHLAFTGILSRPRRLAAHAAEQAGAVVHGHPSARTSVVVRGRPNPLQAAGEDAGLKLMEIKRLQEKGHRIRVLNEQQFWRLANNQ